jgi:hypothetical protein
MELKLEVLAAAGKLVENVIQCSRQDFGKKITLFLLHIAQTINDNFWILRNFRG